MTVRVGIDLSWIGASAPADRPAADAVLAMLADLAVSPRGGLVPVLLGRSSLARHAPRVEGRSLTDALETHTVPVPDSRVLRVGVQSLWLGRRAASLELDLLHAAGGTTSGGSDLPVVLSVHDLRPLERPRGVSPGRLLHHRRSVPAAVESASRVIVPSDFVRRRLVEHLGVDRADVDVVPWPLPPHADPAPIDTVRAWTGIIGRFFLVSTPTDRLREHTVAIRAMRYLVDRHAETTLVLAGPEGALGSRLRAEIDRLGLEHRVVRVPDPSEAVRSALVEEAIGVIDASVYGGGSPEVLEAMACGVPVVVADGGPAAELVRGAGAVIPPGDDVQLAVELHRLLEDDRWRDRMIEDGLARAGERTPAAAADALVAAYRSVLAPR